MTVLDANRVLQAAYQDALSNPQQACGHTAFIDFVIDNTHLTYKYILFTALLSKATDEAINPLCLQKHSSLPGAYDARTICHRVVVRFEIDVLKKALGGSNEPFLNKPARFPELSKGNAVRRGRDQEILNALCDNLPLVTTSADAYQCLVYLLTKLIKIRAEKEALTVFSISDSANAPSRLMQFIDEALLESFEGEMLTLMVAGTYHLLYRYYQDIVVEVHPVNQSGASSREASDLDIYCNGALVGSNELKDKQYAETDVRHAADKVMQAGGTKMLFIEGPRGNSTGRFSQKIQAEYASRNFLLQIIPCHHFFVSAIGAMTEIDLHEFVRYVLETARETKFKEEVISYINTLAQKRLGLTR